MKSEKKPQIRSQFDWTCESRDTTIRYLKGISNNPRKIESLKRYIESNNYEIDNIIGRDDRDLLLLQLLGHLRDETSICVDPFSEEAILGRMLSSGMHFDPSFMRIIVPEDGDHHFVEFIFNNDEEMKLIMDNVRDQGFDEFITAVCE